MNQNQSQRVCRTFHAGLVAFRSQQALPRPGRRPACASAVSLVARTSHTANAIQGNADKGADTGVPRCNIAFYRRRTEALLRRYLRMALEVGRVPSCLPREALRAKRTFRRRPGTFEDCVIFVHDIERCLEQLDRIHADILTRIALQEYTHREASGMLGVPQTTVRRYYDDALDMLSALLVERSLMGQDE